MNFKHTVHIHVNVVNYANQDGNNSLTVCILFPQNENISLRKNLYVQEIHQFKGEYFLQVKLVSLV